MKITIVTTQNGWLVRNGPITFAEDPNIVIPSSWTFNSLDAAIACLRALMKPKAKLQQPAGAVNK